VPDPQAPVTLPVLGMDRRHLHSKYCVSKAPLTGWLASIAKNQCTIHPIRDTVAPPDNTGYALASRRTSP